MKFSILHLTDIHVKNHCGELAKKFNKLKEAIHTHDSNSSKILVILSGDLAYSGKKEEYDILETHLLELKEDFANKNKQVYFVFAPGNHDCDYSEDQSVRDLMMDGGVAKFSDNIPSDKILDILTLNQTPFFEFSNKFVNKLNRKSLINTYDIEELGVQINIVNTSWLSQKNERPGIVFPVGELAKVKRRKTGINITVYHHPDSWIDKSISSLFKRKIREFSDLVFTGHEHNSTSYENHYFNGDSQYYFEGGEFHNVSKNKTNKQFFKLIDVDLMNRTLGLNDYYWMDKGDYFKKENYPEITFSQGENSNSYGESLSSDFLRKTLRDFGMPIKHSKKRDLELRDFFTFPRLEIKMQDLNGRDTSRFISAEKDFFEFFEDTNFIKIVGEDKSGKSSLAKILFEELFARDFLPILVDGYSLSAANVPFVRNTINKKVAEQYKALDPEKYLQFPSESRVLIVDNFDKTPLQGDKLETLIEGFKQKFTKIIVLEDSNLSYGLLQVQSEVVEESFSEVRIMPLNASQREDLIEKWFSLGDSFSETSYKLNVHQLELSLRSAISEYGIPSYPLFVLTYLQHLDTERDYKIDSSITSNERLLASLIDLSLTRDVAGEISYSTKRSYLTELAHHIYTVASEKNSLTYEEVRKFHAEYCAKRDSNLNQNEIWSALIESKILNKKDDMYGFKYAYLKSYFMANYLRMNITQPSFKVLIDQMIRDIHLSDNSNTIATFSLYTNDTSLIDRLVEKVEGLFSDLDRSSVHELSKTVRDAIRVEDLTIVPPGDHSDEDENLKEDNREVDDSISSHLDVVPVAVKLIKVLGLVIKNSLDNLDGEKRASAVRSIFDLAARLTKLQNLALSKERVELNTWTLAKHIREKTPLLADVEVKQEAARRMIKGVFRFVSGLHDLVSRSVGGEDLKNTYNRMMSEENKEFYEFYHLAIKAEWFKSFPEEEIKALYIRYEKEVFNRPLLRYITFKSLVYQNNLTTSSSQSLCDSLNMDMPNVQMRRILSKS